MLHVSIHAGPLKAASRYNRTDWLDIGYARLDALADYKIELFSISEGARPAVILRDYPRWSASLWDLVARAIALAHFPNQEAPEERLLPAEIVQKKYAWAEELTAILQYAPLAGAGARMLGTLEVRRVKKACGVYQATLHEDLRPSLSAMPFLFRPKYLHPAELIARAAVAVLTGSTETLPPRPVLRLPKSAEIDGEPHILVHRVHEPARTGLLRWLRRINETPMETAGTKEGAVPEKRFLQFLREAL